MAKQDDINLLRDGIRKKLHAPASAKTLRGTQADALEALISPEFTAEQISHSYFKLPTGFGKSVMFSHMAQAYFDAVASSGAKRQKIIIIVPRLSLIKQTQQKLERFVDITATEFSGRKKDAQSDVIITTYNSLSTLFDKIDFDDVGLIFADEAHHMLGDKISERLEFYNKYVPIIGFTATPEYEANRNVANMLSTEIYTMNIPDAVRNGILNPVKNVLYRSSIVCDLATVPARTNGEFDYDNITTKIDPGTIATEIARIYADGIDQDTGIKFRNLRAIINCPNTKIAELQAATINKIMGTEVAIALHKEGISDKKFDRLQEDFISGKYSVACQVNTLTEGFDDVTIAMCINYPTRSRVRAEQAAGRAIRIDENNPNKIAFVVDTIFRATPNDSLEDILYTASNANQVLFKDIAGDIILHPDKFRMPHATNHGLHNHRNVEFVNFELVTDTATLVDLKRRAEERAATTQIPPKGPEWQGALDLQKDPTFPMGSQSRILKALQECRAQMPQYIQKRYSAGNTPLCLHRDGRKQFLELRKIKTDEWQSIEDLLQDKTFPIRPRQVIKELLNKYKSEMPQYIQERYSSANKPLCLHRDGREWLFQKSGMKNIDFKTDEWQSVSDLGQDPTFPINDFDTIKNALIELQPTMPQYIQERQNKRGRKVICLHRDGRELFLKSRGITTNKKTAEWYSTTDLLNDKTFPMKDHNTIVATLQKSKSAMPQYIQECKPTCGKACLCLHRDGREQFLELNKIKTEEWQSATNLAEDETFPMKTDTKIRDKLIKYQSAMPEYIQKRQINNHALLCLHRNGREQFLELNKLRNAQWQSVTKLSNDETFPMKSPESINKALVKYKGQMPQYIQARQSPNGRWGLHLHRDGRNQFLELRQQEKTKSILPPPPQNARE